jgi:hypothetical protein
MCGALGEPTVYPKGEDHRDLSAAGNAHTNEPSAFVKRRASNEILRRTLIMFFKRHQAIGLEQVPS